MSSHRWERRCRHEIVSTILRKCIVPTAKTDIMNSAVLSFTLLNQYLGFLEERKLITKKRKTKKTNQWITTKKGREYLETFEQLQNLLRTH